MADDRVLVLNATGKVGRNVCRALKDAGFDVFGTTRGQGSALTALGVKPVICTYTERADLDRALRETGATRLFVITDYFGAAKGKAEVEIAQGRAAIDAAKAAGVAHLVFMSLSDGETFNEHVKHAKTKLVVEAYLRQSGVPCSILRPGAFFENLDDAANWNPLKKGRISFLTRARVNFCATYDIGRAAAMMFREPEVWLGKTLDVVSWQGDLNDLAAALQRVGGVPVKARLAMPIFLRRLLMKDLHNMFLLYETSPGPRATPAALRQVLPEAMTAEDWFRFRGRYANGEKIGA